MHNILSLILESKKKRVNILRKNREGISSLIKKAPKPKPFKKAISRENKISIIAELKQASPSSGVLRSTFEPRALAKMFIDSKIHALSVLTEEDFFLGKIAYIQEIRKYVDIPILRKDFIIDEVQVLESRAAGADAILLIVRILDSEKLKKLWTLARDLGMDVLVEVHTQKELRRILPFPFDVVGINNRNLDTLGVDLETTAKLTPFISKEATIVSESGIADFKDVLWLKGLGIDAVLIGETIMRSPDIIKTLKELNVDV